MVNVKVILTLIAGSFSLIAMILTTSPARAESDTKGLNPQFIEIVREPAINISPSDTCSTTRYTCTRLTNSADSPQSDVDNDALLNDDKIGDAAIARSGCDCAGCRRAIAQLLQ
jgi:hypothetical protein